MDFSEADTLSATTDNQFILDLMPQHPIYIDLLPDTARAVIGQCHRDGEGARRLLEWEGFSFSNVVDIFDAGPLMSAKRDVIRTLRESRTMKAQASNDLSGARRALVATSDVQGFRCCPTRAVVADGAAGVDRGVLDALRIGAGADVLVWVDDAL
jgi:arginine N-succinyltransferase